MRPSTSLQLIGDQLIQLGKKSTKVWWTNNFTQLTINERERERERERREREREREREVLFLFLFVFCFYQ